MTRPLLGLRLVEPPPDVVPLEAEPHVVLLRAQELRARLVAAGEHQRAAALPDARHLLDRLRGPLGAVRVHVGEHVAHTPVGDGQGLRAPPGRCSMPSRPVNLRRLSVGILSVGIASDGCTAITPGPSPIDPPS